MKSSPSELCQEYVPEPNVPWQSTKAGSTDGPSSGALKRLQRRWTGTSTSLSKNVILFIAADETAEKPDFSSHKGPRRACPSGSSETAAFTCCIAGPTENDADDAPLSAQAGPESGDDTEDSRSPSDQAWEDWECWECYFPEGYIGALGQDFMNAPATASSDINEEEDY
ncbi:hypothetical protein AYL99_11959 [Fonsecaea erecta]|uniref:Uncharacterized protein n=1 Tax=Fonsecaea erecta TaxID=1367422 RepID=A0A178Z348_9EURO|nr:hypothetical protein AYL99_11959 [Fonsecaea erecta]OAP53836.1 hypothetical protein AYL99_11959 [Fonsecaea erecta]